MNLPRSQPCFSDMGPLYVLERLGNLLSGRDLSEEHWDNDLPLSWRNGLARREGSIPGCTDSLEHLVLTRDEGPCSIMRSSHEYSKNYEFQNNVRISLTHCFSEIKNYYSPLNTSIANSMPLTVIWSSELTRQCNRASLQIIHQRTTVSQENRLLLTEVFTDYWRQLSFRRIRKEGTFLAICRGRKTDFSGIKAQSSSWINGHKLLACR